MSKKHLPKIEAAPRIWKKMAATQKSWFVVFYNHFLEELIILSQMGKKAPTVSGDLEVVAHNLACEAVWEFERQGILEGLKLATNK